eukprot:scaffold309089_cov33-Prasinocladus_malaysianus.AAC.1
MARSTSALYVPRSASAREAVLQEMELQSQMASLVGEIRRSCAVPPYLEHALCSVPRGSFLA